MPCSECSPLLGWLPPNMMTVPDDDDQRAADEAEPGARRGTRPERYIR